MRFLQSHFLLILVTITTCFKTYTLASSASSSSSPVPLPSIPINVINLDKDTARWQQVYTELTVKGYVNPASIHRLSAVYGKTLSKDELRTKTTQLARLFCTPGIIGCYLSHTNFWRKVLSENVPYQMVLEDDVILAEDASFTDRVQQMVNELEMNDPQWDVLLLGAFSCVHPLKKYGMYRGQAVFLGDGRKPRRVSDHIHVPHRPLGTHGYILSKRGAQKLLQHASKATWHVDCVVWGLRQLNLYLCHPMLVFQDNVNLESTIGSITGGLESKLPTWQMDDYTKASFAWAMNEVLMRIPLVDVIITTGRYIGLFLGGMVVVGAGSLVSFPSWIFPMYTIGSLSFALMFMRIMKRPETVENIESELSDLHSLDEANMRGETI